MYTYTINVLSLQINAHFYENSMMFKWKRTSRVDRKRKRGEMCFN